MRYLIFILLVGVSANAATYKFEIKNIASGKITHSYVADVESPHNNGWGKPGTYEVLSTDITAQLDAREARANQRRAGIARLKALRSGIDSAQTVDDLKPIILDLIRAAIRD